MRSERCVGSQEATADDMDHGRGSELEFSGRGVAIVAWRRQRWLQSEAQAGYSARIALVPGGRQ